MQTALITSPWRWLAALGLCPTFPGSPFLGDEWAFSRLPGRLLLPRPSGKASSLLPLLPRLPLLTLQEEPVALRGASSPAESPSFTSEKRRPGGEGRRTALPLIILLEGPCEPGVKRRRQDVLPRCGSAALMQGEGASAWGCSVPGTELAPPSAGGLGSGGKRLLLVPCFPGLNSQQGCCPRPAATGLPHGRRSV